MVHRVSARRARQGLVELPHAQALEGLGVSHDGLRAEGRHQLGGAGHEDVAGEDGGGVAPHGLGARGTAAQRGLVHDVVVVEGGDVGQLHGHTGVADLLAGGQGRVAELGGQQGQDRTQALAPGLGQVRGRRVDGLVGAGDHLHEAVLNGLESGDDARLQLGGAQRQ